MKKKYQDNIKMMQLKLSASSCVCCIKYYCCVKNMYYEWLGFRGSVFHHLLVTINHTGFIVPEGKGKGKFYPTTYDGCLEESRGIAVLFL